MSYHGLNEMKWMFSNNRGNVIGIPISEARTHEKAYKIAFEQFYG